jgi:hypothetical protein
VHWHPEKEKFHHRLLPSFVMALKIQNKESIININYISYNRRKKALRFAALIKLRRKFSQEGVKILVLQGN